MPPTRRSHERPYPYDALIAGNGVMLADVPEAWVENKINYFDQSAVSTEVDRSYAVFPPEVESPYALTRFNGGMGQFQQTLDDRSRTHYSLFCDTSGDYPVVGPNVNSQQTLSAAVTQAIDFNGIVYAAAGRYLYKRSNDTGAGWTVVRDFGVGFTIGKMAVYQGTQATAFLFIPIGTSGNYYVMSTAEAFTQHASQGGYGFETIGDELWLWNKETNQWVIRKSTNGGTAATWGGITVIGDTSSAITWMVSVALRLLLPKENGLYAASTDATIVDQELAQEMRPMAASDNGVGAIAWNDTLVLPYGGNLYRYDPLTGSMDQMGPELLQAHGSPVVGPIKAIAAQPGMCLWGGMNGFDGNAYLCRYGSWRVVETSNGPERRFQGSWHGALYRWTGKVLSALFITNLITKGGVKQPRLYAFMTDGTVYWCYLSRTFNAADDPNYEFNTSLTDTKVVYFPRYTGGFPAEFKLLKAIYAGGRNLSSGVRAITPRYKLPTDGAWTSLGAVNSDPGERLQPSGSPSSQSFDLSVELTCTSAASSPVLTEFVTFSSLRTNPVKEIVVSVKAEDNLTDRKGTGIRQSWQDIRTAIEEAMTTNGAITVTTPAGEDVTVTGLQFGHRKLMPRGDRKGEGQQWISTCRMVQTKVTRTRGTWSRAAAYTWGNLAAFTWAEVANL
ncbi:MAG: hypothetical protein U0821_18635 [Chloroflexota bacterium]